MPTRKLPSPFMLFIFAGFMLMASACQPDSSDYADLDTPGDADIQILLVSGQNNHDWSETNAMLLGIIKEIESFRTTISLTPPKGSDSLAWDNWDPDFASYDVVLIDYNGEMWPASIRSRFEAYIEGGGTALSVHAGNNPFPGWEAYEKMIGLLWRGTDAGYRVYMDDAGELVRIASGVEDVKVGHGKLHDWQITTRDADHPIMQGVPDVWYHPHDELYHGQRGPAENMNVLATAYSDPASGGTGKHELMIWWIPYGQGKVLTFLPGHHWPEQEDVRAFHDIGFRTLLNRSLEWLATGDVTIPVPDNFPTADKESLR